MTLLEFYEHSLIRMKKFEAPPLTLEDFNSFVNKAVDIFKVKAYRQLMASPTQENTDAFSMLISRCVLSRSQTEPNKWILTGSNTVDAAGKEWTSVKDDTSIPNDEASFVFELPENYYHLWSCSIGFKVLQAFDCYRTGTIFSHGAEKHTAIQNSTFISNVYANPAYDRPKYSIEDAHDILIKSNGEVYDFLSNPNDLASILDVDVTQSKIKRFPKIRIKVGVIKKTNLQIENVVLDYFRTPRKYILTMEDLRDQERDNTLRLEFADSYCEEILDIFLSLIGVLNSDQRITQYSAITPPAAPTQQ